LDYHEAVTPIWGRQFNRNLDQLVVFLASVATATAERASFVALGSNSWLLGYLALWFIVFFFLWQRFLIISTLPPRANGRTLVACSQVFFDAAAMSFATRP
jgi:predicted RNA-binding protein associated with RNAse of E/G family